MSHDETCDRFPDIVVLGVLAIGIVLGLTGGFGVATSTAYDAVRAECSKRTCERGLPELRDWRCVCVSVEAPK